MLGEIGSKGGFAMTGAVVCGIDDSAGATGTARVAHALAVRFGLALLFVHVVQPGASEEEVAAAAGLLREAVDGVAPDGGTRSTIETGQPADRLVPLARKQEASFVPPAASERQVGEGGEPSFAGGIVRFDLGSSSAPVA